MLLNLFSDLGAWSWMVLGFVLLAAEIVLPGVFLLWTASRPS
jgi:membrane protein implicated in regulation of membrane protease activity